MCRCDSGSCGDARYELSTHTFEAKRRDIEALVNEQADPKGEHCE